VCWEVLASIPRLLGQTRSSFNDKTERDHTRLPPRWSTGDVDENLPYHTKLAGLSAEQEQSLQPEDLSKSARTPATNGSLTVLADRPGSAPPVHGSVTMVVASAVHHDTSIAAATQVVDTVVQAATSFFDAVVQTTPPAMEERDVQVNLRGCLDHFSLPPLISLNQAITLT